MTLADTISAWIFEQVRRAGAEGAVVGLSGGVDSSLTAVLTRKALGDGVLGLLMPCHSHPQDVAYARGVPQPIIEKPPSGGLWPGQTDEGEMGITYQEIDEVLQALEAGKVSHLPAETLAKVRRMMDHSAHKRAMPPICPLS